MSRQQCLKQGWLRLINVFMVIIIVFAAALLFEDVSKKTSRAISAEQRKIFNYNINYYNICSPGAASGNGSISDAVAAANDNADAVFRAITSYNFKSNGNKPLNVVQAAAVLGNLQSESGFDPMNGVSSGNTYKGIAQWGDGRWDSIADPKTDLTNQIEHLIEEMDGSYSDALQEFWAASTVADLAKATFAFVRNYEVAIINGGGSTRWTDHNTACSTVQGWDSCSSIGGGNPRWPNAQAWYNKYKDTDIAATSSSNSIDERIIWVGDSRTEGMQDAITNGNNVWIAKTSTGYNWFNDTAAKQVTTKIEDDDIIVFNFGVNDLNNVDKYINKLNELAGGDWSKASKIIVMSVNPVIDGKNAASNAAIEQFNNTMKNGLSEKITYVDTYSTLKDSLSESDFDNEGLHYTNDVYKKIYNIIRNGNSSGKRNDTICIDDESSAYGATEYADDGAIIYMQCDNQWGSSAFGSSTICEAGCGPAAMAMIITALTGKTVTPDMTARDGSDAYVPGSGSSYSLPSILAKTYDIRTESIPNTVDDYNKVLNKGGMIWLCGAGPLPFSDNGHCVGIRGRTSNGKWLTFDSSQGYYGHDSNKEYDPKTVVINARSGSASAIYKK